MIIGIDTGPDKSGVVFLKRTKYGYEIESSGHISNESLMSHTAEIAKEERRRLNVICEKIMPYGRTTGVSTFKSINMHGIIQGICFAFSSRFYSYTYREYTTGVLGRTDDGKPHPDSSMRVALELHGTTKGKPFEGIRNSHTRSALFLVIHSLGLTVEEFSGLLKA